VFEIAMLQTQNLLLQVMERLMMTVRRKMTLEMRLVLERVNKRRNHRSSMTKRSPSSIILAVRLWRGARGVCSVLV
jgi:hypothetical protein